MSALPGGAMSAVMLAEDDLRRWLGRGSAWPR